ncbi:MAG: DUF2065 family protein [Alphaproteobacteria bacterium]|nr:DUF2065 family protein [Alphaproteobacteria bacterium]
MIDLLTALGLMFFIEGALYALFPDQMKRMAAQVALMPPAQLRTVGLFFAIFGFIFMAALRNH